MVVFVAGDGGVEGALAEACGDGVEESAGLAFSLLLATAVTSVDAEEEVTGAGVFGDELEEALVLAGGAAPSTGSGQACLKALRLPRGGPEPGRGPPLRLRSGQARPGALGGGGWWLVVGDMVSVLSADSDVFTAKGWHG